MQFFTGLVAAVLCLFSALAAQEKPAGDTYPVRIIIEPRADAKFYQIEWLEDDTVTGQEEAPPEKSLREKITRTEIRRNLPQRFRFFRLRSAYRDDLYGPWGEVVKIQRPVRHAKSQVEPDSKPSTSATDKRQKQTPAALVNEQSAIEKETAQAKGASTRKDGAKPVEPQDVFAQVIDKDGKQKWVLRGSALHADRLDRNNPLWYEVECLTEKNAPENTNGRQRYAGPISFTRAGQYRLSLFNTDNPAEETPLQTWIFWVYTDVPRTHVKFFAPFLHGKGGFIVGGKTKISLAAHFAGAAIDQIEYRIYPQGSAPGAWQKYEEEIEVSTFAQGKYGNYEIEYRATNVAGNSEVPQLRRLLVDARGPEIEERTGENGAVEFSFRDENFPIIVRIYQNGLLVKDLYFRQWRANETVTAPTASGYEIRAIDLLGNETRLSK